MMKILKRKRSKALIFNASLIAFLLMNLSAKTQTRLPQNIKRITITSQYIFENGKNTENYWPVYQEMFDSLGRMHTEIEYNLNDPYPHNYVWHTYKGKQKVKTEVFKDSKLTWIKEFSYNKDSLINLEVITKVTPVDTLSYLMLYYTYNQDKKPTFIEGKKADGERAYTSKSTYDAKGTELTRKVRVNDNFIPFDSILQLTCVPKYDSIGRLKNAQITKQTSKSAKKSLQYGYKYDKMNNIIEITIRDNKGKLISREERIYQTKKNRLQQIKVYNSKNELVKWLAKRYEIYRTRDLRFSEIDY